MTPAFARSISASRKRSPHAAGLEDVVRDVHVMLRVADGGLDRVVRVGGIVEDLDAVALARRRLTRALHEVHELLDARIVLRRRRLARARAASMPSPRRAHACA